MSNGCASSYPSIVERWETTSRGLWDSKLHFFLNKSFIPNYIFWHHPLYVSYYVDAYEDSFLWPVGYAHLHQCNHCTSSLKVLSYHTSISDSASGLFFCFEITQWYNISYHNCLWLGKNHHVSCYLLMNNYHRTPGRTSLQLFKQKTPLLVIQPLTLNPKLNPCYNCTETVLNIMTITT